MAAGADLFNLGVVLFGVAGPAEVVGDIIFILTGYGAAGKRKVTAFRGSVAFNAFVACLVSGVRKYYGFLFPFNLPSIFQVNFGGAVINSESHSYN
jgi:hypothetical protein